jgi:hypothetical protein
LHPLKSTFGAGVAAQFGLTAYAVCADMSATNMRLKQIKSSAVFACMVLNSFMMKYRLCISKIAHHLRNVSAKNITFRHNFLANELILIG